jgi:hypothetical protein
MICRTLGGTPIIGKIVWNKLKIKKIMRFEIKMAENEEKKKKSYEIWN